MSSKRVRVTGFSVRQESRRGEPCDRKNWMTCSITFLMNILSSRTSILPPENLLRPRWTESSCLSVSDLDLPELMPFHTEMLVLNLIGRDRRNIQHLLTHGSCDLSYYLPGRARFRVNIFSQRGTLSIAMRQLPTVIPTFEELDLPRGFEADSGGEEWASCW